MKEFYLSYNFTSQTIHQVLHPRKDSDIRQFHNQVDQDRAASPASTIKIFKLTETSAEVIA